MRKLIFSIVILAGNIGIGFCGSDKEQRPAVMATVELGANYLAHMRLLAANNPDSNYIKAYSSSLSAEDKDRLRAAFGNDQKGYLNFFLLFFPADLNLDTKESIDKYFRGLSDGTENPKAAKTFRKEYKDSFKDFRKWRRLNDIEEYVEELKPFHSQIAQVAGIYMRNFENYRTNIWPAEKPAIEQTAAKLNEYFSGNDLVEKWRAVTGYKFKSFEYRAVLCSAGDSKYQSMGMSLSAGKGAFYSGMEPALLIQLISQQIGEHILDGIKETAMKSVTVPPQIMANAYYCLCKFYNSKIFPEGLLYPTPAVKEVYQEDKFIPVYEQLYLANPGISAEELLAGGLKNFH